MIDNQRQIQYTTNKTFMLHVDASGLLLCGVVGMLETDRLTGSAMVSKTGSTENEIGKQRQYKKVFHAFKGQLWIVRETAGARRVRGERRSRTSPKL